MGNMPKQLAIVRKQPVHHERVVKLRLVYLNPNVL
jgi:hypothetical protein